MSVEDLNIVIDTNVFISALRSRNGTSFDLLSKVGTGQFQVSLSVPVVFEYEDVALRMLSDLKLNQQDIEDVVDYLCLIAHKQTIFFLWRPLLKDPKDDMVLELAVNARCSHIVTFNIKDFASTEKFGIEVITPKMFLELLEDTS